MSATQLFWLSNEGLYQTYMELSRHNPLPPNLALGFYGNEANPAVKSKSGL